MVVIDIVCAWRTCIPQLCIAIYFNFSFIFSSHHISSFWTHTLWSKIEKVLSPWVTQNHVQRSSCDQWDIIIQFNFIGSIVSRFFCHYVRKISRVTNLFYWHKHWLWLVAFIESQRKKSSTVILLWPMNSKSVRLMDFSLFPLRLSTVRPIDWLKSIESFE